MVKNRLLLALLVRLFILVLPLAGAGEDSGGEGPVPVPMDLQHGRFDMRWYPAPGGDPRALVIFGSGDGGWSPWEHVVSLWLQEANVSVAGLDFDRYSATDFDQPMLAEDLAAIARFCEDHLDAQGVPVLYGGWSMGAVQAVAAAAGTNRPSELAGLLLLSLDSRGRYGIRSPDRVGITPAGPGTFDLHEFTDAVKDLRVVQYHGTADFMSKTTWIRLLKSPHQLYELPSMNHGFDGPSDEFRPVLLQGLAWALGDDSCAADPEGTSRMDWSGMVVLGALLLLLLVVIGSRRAAMTLLPLTVTLCGVLGLLETVFPRPAGLIAEMEEWIPLEISQHGRFLLFLSGAMLLMLARGLARHKRVAWYMTTAILSVSALLHFTQTFEWNRSIVAAVLLAALLRHRKIFAACSDAPSFKAGILIAGGALLLLTAYGAVSIHEFSERGIFGSRLSWYAASYSAVQTVFQFRTDLDELAGREAAHLLNTLRLQGLGIGFLTLVLVLRPVIVRRPMHSSAEAKRVRQLVAACSDDPMTAFALLPDKHYYFEAGVEGAVVYALWRDVAVVLADPVCRPEVRAALVDGFMRFCQACDWKPVFYCLPAASRDLYESTGFQLLRIAEEARIDLREFSLAGKRFQNLRTARNKALKNGLRFGWYGAGMSGLDFSLERQMDEISREWLSRKRGGELGFDLSAYNLASIRETGAAWVQNPEGRVEAFATWYPYLGGRGRCLDLMRSRSQVKDVMDFLILESMESFRAQGVEEVSFGSAPLANLSDPSGHNRNDRAVRFVFEKFDRFYGYKRLFFFKQKYHPRWEARYLAYPRGLSLAAAGLAVAGVHLTRGFRSLFRS